MSGVTKAVIPAAGWGTRFLPAAKSVPKEMMPVVDKPAIHYVVEDAVSAGCDVIYIIAGSNKVAIQSYFDRSRELERVLENKGAEDTLREMQKISEMADIVYLTQKEQRGLGDAIYCARKHVGDEDFFVLLGDDIVVNNNGISCAKQLAIAHKKYSSPVFAVQNVPKEDVSKFGIVEVRRDMSRYDTEARHGSNVPMVHTVSSLVEKPKPDVAPTTIDGRYLAIIGRYIFPPEIFDHIGRVKPSANGEIQITDAMNSLNKETEFIACEFYGTRYDLGDKLDWLRANVELGMIHKETCAVFKEYLNSERFRERLLGRKADKPQ